MKQEKIFLDSKGDEHILPDGIVPELRIGAYGIIEEKGKILLAHSKEAKQWEVPGGGVDLGEGIIQGLIREFREETGYTCRPLEEVPFFIQQNQFYSYYYGKKWYYGVLMYYRVERVGDLLDEESFEAFEMDQVKFFTKEEILNLPRTHTIDPVLSHIK